MAKTDQEKYKEAVEILELGTLAHGCGAQLKTLSHRLRDAVSGDLDGLRHWYRDHGAIDDEVRGLIERVRQIVIGEDA